MFAGAINRVDLLKDHANNCRGSGDKPRMCIHIRSCRSFAVETMLYLGTGAVFKGFEWKCDVDGIGQTKAIFSKRSTATFERHTAVLRKCNRAAHKVCKLRLPIYLDNLYMPFEIHKLVATEAEHSAHFYRFPGMNFHEII
ncbi:hypothetical protein CHS0354_033914 [Potamilus streckersoni]|uniref:Uncharacterized protein n=1 Tax=Potamilus streckersoni TaxID=2493646 RepID=A0AAE0RX32_9BIVA|nr:hypothetical protein CHS0354_033914 [Potamilus streckersoni]